MRAVILGLLGACTICGLTYFNDNILSQTPFIGDHFPYSIHAALIIFLVVINPLIFFFKKRLALSGKELVVIYTLTVTACCLPGGGLMRQFVGFPILPYRFAQTESGWQEQKIMENIPKKMLADITGDKTDMAVNGFMQGMRIGTKHVSVLDIPWKAWVRPLRFWIPLILILWIGIIGLALVVHREWSSHENLSYPIATVVNFFLPKEGELQGGIFGNRLFRMGAISVLFIHLNNYAYVWFPSLIQIPLSFDFSSFRNIFPAFFTNTTIQLYQPKIYFVTFAIAYFMASDIAFSVGISPFLRAAILGLFFVRGINLSNPTSGVYTAGLSPIAMFTLGSYLGIAFAVIFMGRYFYRNVFGKALFIKTNENTEVYEVWGARLFLVCIAFFIINLILLGLDWKISILFTIGIVFLYVCQARIVAESGMYFAYLGYPIASVIFGIFGVKALGPQALLIMFIIMGVFGATATRESIMPYIVNSLKLLEQQKVKISKIAPFSVIALILGMAVTIPVTLYFQYDNGMINANSMTLNVPRTTFSSIVRIKERLIAQGQETLANTKSAKLDIGNISPDFPSVVSLIAGLAAVFLFTSARLHFPRWPLHPILFALWGSIWAIDSMGVSFLLGWLVKVLIVKFGGEKIYQKLKPLMIGLIAGEFTAALVISIIGMIYYFATGLVPKSFWLTAG